MALSKQCQTYILSEQWYTLFFIERYASPSSHKFCFGFSILLEIFPFACATFKSVRTFYNRFEYQKVG